MNSAELREKLQTLPRWAAGFILAAGLVGAAVFRSGTYAALGDQVAELKSASDKNVAAVRLSAGLEDQIAELDRVIARARKRMIDPDNRGENLKHFYGLAEAAKVDVISIAPLGIDKGTQFRPVPFQVTVSGSFENVLKFLRKIERGPYFFAPRECRIQRGAPGVEESTVADANAPQPDRVTLAMTFQFAAPK